MYTDIRLVSGGANLRLFLTAGSHCAVLFPHRLQGCLQYGKSCHYN